MPQDDAMGRFRRGDYALDEQGRYSVVPTSGWEAERAANELALQAVDRDIARAWQQVRAGRRSPLAYHLARAMLTPAILAEAVGTWTLRVWWHLRPSAFSKVAPEPLEKYARALGVTVEELRTIPEQPITLAGAKD